MACKVWENNLEMTSTVKTREILKGFSISSPKYKELFQIICKEGILAVLHIGVFG